MAAKLTADDFQNTDAEQEWWDNHEGDHPQSLNDDPALEIRQPDYFDPKHEMTGDADEVAEIIAINKKWIVDVEARYTTRKGESREQTLHRLNFGHACIRRVISYLEWAVDSEKDEQRWFAFLYFRTLVQRRYKLFYEAIFRELPPPGPKPKDPAYHPAVIDLTDLTSDSEHGEYYARNINERLTKAWSNGEHLPVSRQVKPNETVPLSQLREDALRPTGVTIEGGFRDFKFCSTSLKKMPDDLAQPLERNEADAFWSDYKPVSLYANTSFNVRD